MAENPQQGTEQQKDDHPEFAIQRLYTKDVSFEAPNTPSIFQQEWKPDLKFDLQVNSQHIENEFYEVTITITATVKSQEKVAFVAEVKQAGIFTIKHFPKEQLPPLLGSVCPAIIYPYARERISDLSVAGGFPQLCLAPVNFDALYQQHQQQAAKKAEGESEQAH